MSLKVIEEQEGVILAVYGTWINQMLISGMTQGLEKDVEASQVNMGVAANIFTVFIELAQNVMNYSKPMGENLCDEQKSEGQLVVRHHEQEYVMSSKNIISQQDREKIEPKLIEVSSLDKAALKKRYRELRRVGKEKHSKGAGIGFYEIAKRCDSISYSFQEINSNKLYFQLQAVIKYNLEPDNG